MKTILIMFSFLPFNAGATLAPQTPAERPLTTHQETSAILSCVKMEDAILAAMYQYCTDKADAEQEAELDRFLLTYNSICGDLSVLIHAKTLLSQVTAGTKTTVECQAEIERLAIEGHRFNPN